MGWRCAALRGLHNFKRFIMSTATPNAAKNLDASARKHFSLCQSGK